MKCRNCFGRTRYLGLRLHAAVTESGPHSSAQQRPAPELQPTPPPNQAENDRSRRSLAPSPEIPPRQAYSQGQGHDQQAERTQSVPCVVSCRQ
ncbi:hypothetical protein BDQ94DRAFT_179459 [Aspergillus welwitschiae]|uniref:Uncharacterized protein n=1 Tax=Aspergillus welwitschiae TaxID=1341132 RepID=A0A3F3PH77_9EURO|nr:hypothetical protein BDQ94DRAFT_179459 [Aspergillus welwitschiae]RDH26197.1 hypothetical protein BDQ94DRAFT_179459 [Aspergillus welwitschiae]